MKRIKQRRPVHSLKPPANQSRLSVVRVQDIHRMIGEVLAKDGGGAWKLQKAAPDRRLDPRPRCPFKKIVPWTALPGDGYLMSILLAGLA